MRGGTQTALALGVGYVLGRRRKMRMTTMLAVEIGRALCRERV